MLWPRRLAPNGQIPTNTLRYTAMGENGPQLHDSGRALLEKKTQRVSLIAPGRCFTTFQHFAQKTTNEHTQATKLNAENTDAHFNPFIIASAFRVQTP